MVRFVTGALLAACLGALSGCASSSQSPSDTTVPGASTATAGSTTTPSVSDSDDGGATFTMPDEVGRVLQSAQDDIQRVSHDPVFYTSSKDATGRGRHQILDRDWKVCSQNVPAGRRVQRRTVTITFSVVKLAETCP